MAIGKLRCHVFHVEDLEVGQRFWSAVTGIEPIPSVFPGRAAYLGQANPWHHEVILWKVDAPKGAEVNRSHIDIWVQDVDAAIDEVIDIGGALKRAPTIYPRPHTYGEEPARIDWAVMQDPFGNEFCVISALTPDESRAVAEAGTADTPGLGDDHWREAAGRARKQWWTNQTDNDNSNTDKEHAHGHSY